ncbi:MAG: hypothetical protein GOP50_05325 [Candidatus Heimdallarchaeota archaeon]|nr:hypothetical protein [Candidatus Heimdallarchaeota archaeon]
MIDSAELISYLHGHGFTLASGVPCSYFKELFIELEKSDKINYVSATREDEAVGISCGYYLGGKQSFVIMQNSGLATIGDALTSLAQLYQIPLLLFVSYRGLEPDTDFPEHSIMGDVTEEILNAYNVPYEILYEQDWQDTINRAIEEMITNNEVVCILVEKGVLSE